MSAIQRRPRSFAGVPASSGAGRASLLWLLPLALMALLLAADLRTARGGGGQARAADDDGSSGCLHCHEGIEPMHPEADLSCVDCHGGDASTRNKVLAHVARQGDPTDERVAPQDENLSWRRFRNPMDLRVVDRTCGTCHEQEVAYLETSLHGTTAGHLSDGFYEMGLFRERGSQYAVFPVGNADVEGGAVDRLVQVPAFSSRGPEDELSTHYADLARKECMQCHLWSEGRAVRGRVGFDGDYRGEGCAACHVEYALDGLSESADTTTPKTEPGHPRTHSMVRAASTQTCTSCHYGDASIGLHFRGLSQLPPGAPGGPDIPGTTDAPLNRVYYLDDPSMVPPDVHHERGMHCVDCHTFSDVMGDGRLHGQMEHAVSIECQSCHGDFDEPARLSSSSGARLPNLRWRDDELILTSKVTGEEYVVPQASRVLERSELEFNAHAMDSMDEHHAELECYTCHAGWNVNFLGFHFSRNASLSQLDLLSGRRTEGQVTTQEKVFATWKSFYAGKNEKGRIAPYLTGFSTMGSVWDEEGELVLDQVMPVTREGLSGLTMVHHQLHSTRPTARSCVECHRSSSTWGMGSPNFRLTRQLAFVGDRRGIEVVALNRGGLASSVPLAKLVLPDIVDIEVREEPLQGHATHVFATEGGRGLHVIDVSDPTQPRRVAFVATINPRGMHLAGEHLYLADGIGGLRVYDVSEPEEPKEVARLATFDAHDVTVQWPWAYVADGPGGLAIADIRAPIAPKLLSGLDLNGESQQPMNAISVATLFQYSRPMAEGDEPVDERTEARMLCAVLDADAGLFLVDATEPGYPEVLYPRRGRFDSTSRGGRGTVYRGLALLSHVDLAEAQGGEPTRERDYAYLVGERRGRAALFLLDVTDPERPRTRSDVDLGGTAEMVAGINVYNPPFLQRVLLVPGEDGIAIGDATDTAEPTAQGTFPAIPRPYVVRVEEFAIDQMLDEDGQQLKDISRDHSRWLYRSEIERLLDVPGEELGTISAFDLPPEWPGETARLHLAQLDEDGSFLLEGEEYEAAGGAGVDENGDGRIALIELADHVGLIDADLEEDEGMGMRMPEGRGAGVAPSRVDEEGDISRLLDGVNPYDYDRDENGRLDREETSRAFFAALDLDGDERLNLDEASRYPGELRQLRYKDEAAWRTFRILDKNGDKKVTRREFGVLDAEFEAMDLDRDGFIQLVPDLPESMRELGLVAMAVGARVDVRPEWPLRRIGFTTLPPIVDADLIWDTFDEDGDRRIVQTEMRDRPDLFRELAGNRSVVERDDIGRRINFLGPRGVEITYDDFERRWDLDGDGRVEPEEMPDVPALRFRGILDGERRRRR